MRTKFLALLSLFALNIDAQGIYTKITKYDKFDDVVAESVVKTLITKTDSSFIVETKGQKPIAYRYIDAPMLAMHEGRRDSLANLVANVYGYEDQYLVITDDIIGDIKSEVDKKIKETYDSLGFKDDPKVLAAFQLLSKIKELPTITVRTISKYQHFYEYDTDLLWIRFKDGSRVIYSKE